MTRASRRTVLTAAAAGSLAPVLPGIGLPGIGAAPAHAGAPNILKPLPPDRFRDLGTNAEMRWDSVDPRRYLTPQADLFVRNHTRTPLVDPRTYRLTVVGDGLRGRGDGPRTRSLSLADLRRMPRTSRTTVLECTGNGRSFFGSQQGRPAPGTPWTLGAVGAVRWEGVRLGEVLDRVGVDRRAVSVMATGLDDPFVSGGVDYGRVRRPFPIDVAWDDALLAWGADGADLLPDHGAPLRLVLPGWIGIASIKWLGTLEVSRTELTSPWNTTFYRLTGGDFGTDGPPLTINPVRSALELAWGATLPASSRVRLTGRAWSGAGPITRVEVSTDGARTWHPARLDDRRSAWTRWSLDWDTPAAGPAEIAVRATDVRGRTQPDVAAVNDAGYFFDAVVRHPVTLA
ncbi:sulfite oxidase [Nocardioides sp.]|uniref:sulfite oxidase n=1 Tax=Nocardioides sp. TaxID=35761 RepID=UPI0035120F45